MSRRQTLDMAAICASGLCIVHCAASVAGLFALGFLSALGWVDEWFHQALLVLIIPVTTLAIGMGYRQHRRDGVLLLAIVALSAMLAIAFFEEALHQQRWLEALLTAIAGSALIAAHMLNIRHCRDCQLHSEECTDG